MIAGIVIADSGASAAAKPAEEGLTAVEWQVRELQAAGVEVIEVVVGADADEVVRLVAADDVEPIVNDRWQEGEAASWRVGATATPRNASTAVLVRVMQPRQAHVIRAVLDEHMAARSRVTRPFSGDVPGWPVCIDAEVLARVRNLPDGADVEDALRAYDTLVVRVS